MSTFNLRGAYHFFLVCKFWVDPNIKHSHFARANSNEGGSDQTYLCTSLRARQKLTFLNHMILTSLYLWKLGFLIGQAHSLSINLVTSVLLKSNKCKLLLLLFFTLFIINCLRHCVFFSLDSVYIYYADAFYSCKILMES